MRVIVTRPQREAQGWVQELAALGFEVEALPLIEIAPAPDAAALRAAWMHLGDYAAVMFVSGNAVDGFFAARPDGAPPGLGAGTRAWATGPGTCSALLRAGVAPAAIDVPDGGAAQFDSEALWQLVGARVRPGQRVLIVRGSDGQAQGPEQGVGRNWLARQLDAAGALTDFVVSYRRLPPDLGARQLAVARAAAGDGDGDGAVWLFSSSEAVANLRALLPRQDWTAARAIATHARIADAARAAGFGTVLQARPALADIRASLESLR